MYKKEFITLVLTNREQTNEKIEHECMNFFPIIVNLGERNAEETIKKLKAQIKAGVPVNELEIIYLPLYHSPNLRPVEILKQCAELISQLDIDNERKRKMAAMALLVSNKVVKKEDLNKIWEEIKKMYSLKILEVAEEKGMEKGHTKGKADLLTKLLSKKLNAPQKSISKIVGKLTPTQLDKLAMDIFIINTIDEVKEYVKMTDSEEAKV